MLLYNFCCEGNTGLYHLHGDFTSDSFMKVSNCLQYEKALVSYRVILARADRQFTLLKTHVRF